MPRKGLSFEDFEIDAVYHTDRRTVTEADHVNFTTSYGFCEPLFMDQTYVETQTPYAKRVVPGALTFSIAEGLTILSGLLHKTGLACLGVELEVLKPVFIGDSLTVEITIAAKRESKKPDRGIVTFLHRVNNQSEEAVMEYRVKRLMRRRS